MHAAPEPPRDASAHRLASRLLERLFGPWVRWVTPATLRADAMAGLLGAVLVLPQGIAFATLAGLPPEYGLYTAVVPCIIAALFGSSWHVMSGPTNANSLALFAMLSPLALAFSPAYIQLALAVTVMVGVLQWLIGALRLGMLANFISPAVLFGFTSGAALLIAVHALPDLLGLAAAPEHGAGAVLAHVLTQLTSAKPAALAVAAITLAVALGLRRYRRRWPYMLIGLVVATALAWVWSRFLGGGATPASSLRVIGQIATPWPRFELPRISWAQASDLVGLAFALTIVALGQAISIAKTVALRSGQRIDANREFRGQGLSNIIGGFFSSYVSCGSMNRSMPNLEAGARTPLASVFSALLLLGLVALSSQLLAQIPMAALSALLLLVALTLLDFARWRQLFSLSRTDFSVALATMVATVTIRLEMAILLGMLLSLMSFLYRTSRPAMRSMGFDSRGLDRQFVVIDDAPQACEETRAAPFQSGPQNRLCRAAGAAAPSGGSAVREATSVGATAASAGPPPARPAPSGGSAVREVTSVGATAASAGPPPARPAPSGGSAAHEETSVGATAASAGPPPARPAPSGGSAVHEETSVGATAASAGPPPARPAPSGGSAAHEVASVGATFLPECPQLKLLRMEGEVYFGATQHVADILHALRSQPNPQKHLLVMAKSMNFIDLAGAELWEAELAARRAMGGNLYFHRPRPEVIRMWRKTGFTDVLGPAHQFSDKFTAISTIFSKLDPDICRHCSARIFWECKTAPGADDPANQPKT